MAALFHVLGFNDGVHTCDCCGKTDLKGTFGIEMIETGELLHYGSVCVTRNTGYAKKEINAMAKAYEAERVKAARAEFRATPEYAAAQAKHAEARKLGATPGAQYKAFVGEAVTAERAVCAAIAQKYNVATYQL